MFKNDLKIPKFPFITRDMLKFGHKYSFGIRLTVAADSANPVNLRVLTRDGILEHEITTVTDGSRQSFVSGIDDFPIFVGVVDNGNAFAHGECWASVSLDIDGIEAIPLCSGYVYQEKGISFPNTSQQPAIPGRGMITQVLGSNPAAGAEASISVPQGEIWLVHAVRVQLVTDANAANRRPHFVFTGPGGAIYDTANDVDIAANSTVNLSAAVYGSLRGGSQDNDLFYPMAHNTWIGPEGTITTETVNIQVGDNYGIPRALVEKYFGTS